MVEDGIFSKRYRVTAETLWKRKGTLTFISLVASWFNSSHCQSSQNPVGLQKNSGIVVPFLSYSCTDLIFEALRNKSCGTTGFYQDYLAAVSNGRA